MRQQGTYPRIYLAIDNCFAYKRWTEPDEWAGIISDLGVFYIEASADTELDPLYMGKEYLADWTKRVKEAEAKYKVKVTNLYSGHGTYSTLGLAHTDARVRERLTEQWFKPMIDIAVQLDAGMGFFAHGFSETVMQDPKLYESFYKNLVASLGCLAGYGAQKGCREIGLEQMYTPYLVPWTIDGTKALLGDVKELSGRDFYFTEDVGHHHTKYTAPTREQIKEAVIRGEKQIWLGPDRAYEIYERAGKRGSISESELDQIEELIKEGGRFFAKKEDGDCYEWLRRLGRYAPIIHLQQTDGRASAHKPFTKAENAAGIIKGKAVLEALKQSYDRETEDEKMPKPCRQVCLTLELFSETAQTSREILRNYEESVRYWRKWIPEDGMRLDELAERASYLTD